MKDDAWKEERARLVRGRVPIKVGQCDDITFCDIRSVRSDLFQTWIFKPHTTGLVFIKMSAGDVINKDLIRFKTCFTLI